MKSALHILFFFSVVWLSYAQVTPLRQTTKPGDAKSRQVEINDLPHFTPYEYVRSARDPFLDKSVKETIIGSYKPSVLNKLILLSWLDEGGETVIYVQNIDTNEVQKITSAPNKDNLRLVEIRPNADLKLFEAIISDGNQQGSVKFRLVPTKTNPQSTSTPAPIPQAKPPEVAPGQKPRNP